jgi:hypothetical protein
MQLFIFLPFATQTVYTTAYSLICRLSVKGWKSGRRYWKKKDKGELLTAFALGLEAGSIMKASRFLEIRFICFVIPG